MQPKEDHIPMPEERGFAIAYQVMSDAAAFHHAFDGHAKEARKEVEELANRIKFYRGFTRAYEMVLAEIDEAERKEKRAAEERQQQQLRELMMTMAESMQPGKDAAKADAGQEKPKKPAGLPKELTTEEAKAVWKRLIDVGLVDQNYMPVNLSQTEKAVLAQYIAGSLNIRDKWKVFGKLWDVSTMRNYYNTALGQKKTLDFQDRLKSLFT